MGIRYLQSTAGPIPFISISGRVEDKCPMDGIWTYNLQQTTELTGLSQQDLGNWFGQNSEPTFYKAFHLAGGANQSVYIGDLGTITNHGDFREYNITGMYYCAEGYTVSKNGETIVNGYGAILTTGIYYPNESDSAVSQYLCVGIVDDYNHVSFGVLQGCWGDVYGKYPSNARPALRKDNTLSIGEGKTAQDVYTMFDDDSVWSDTPEPGPTPPTPTPTKKGGFDLRNRYNPILKTNGVGIYVMSEQNVQDLFEDLWSTNIIEIISDIAVGTAGTNAGDAIVGLYYYYGIKDDIPESTDNYWVTIGSKVFKGGKFSTNEIISKVATKEMIEHDCGTINVPAQFGNYLDFMCDYQIYLPFIGFVHLNANDVVGGSISVRYNINLFSGDALCYISVSNSRCDDIQMVIPCNIAENVPLNHGTVTDVGMRAANVIGKSITAGVSIAGGGGAAATASVMGAETLSNITPDNVISRGGCLGGYSSFLGDLNAFILIDRPVKATPNTLDSVIGARSCEVAQLSSKHGFVKASAVKPESINTNCKYIDEILALVQSGVVMP